MSIEFILSKEFKSIHIHFNNFSRLKMYDEDNTYRESFGDNIINLIEAELYIALGGRILAVNLGCQKTKEKGIHFLSNDKSLINSQGIYLNTKLDNEITSIISGEFNKYNASFGLIFFGATDGEYWSRSIIIKMVNLIVSSISNESIEFSKLNDLVSFSTTCNATGTQ